jgi:hypothetical protein
MLTIKHAQTTGILPDSFAYPLDTTLSAMSMIIIQPRFTE